MSCSPRLVPFGVVGLAVSPLLVVVLAGCSTSKDPTGDRSPASSPATSGGPASPSDSPGTTPAPSTSTQGSGGGSGRSGRDVRKLVTFVVENHSFSEMQHEMPFVAELAGRYGYASDYRALTHPSLPNYLAIAGGETFGVSDDDPPSDHPLSGPSIFGRALDAGSSAGLYAEGMTGNCELETQDRYAVKHNPWAYFADERDVCDQYDVPLDHLSEDIRTGSLPAVGMVIPDLCNDAHDCSLSQADGWLRDVVGEMLSGPDWKAGHLAIVITADEDDRTDDNHILTVVAHPSLDHSVVRTPMTHYDLGRAYADVGGFEPLGNSRSAASLLTDFGLTT